MEAAAPTQLPRAVKGVAAAAIAAAAGVKEAVAWRPPPPPWLFGTATNAAKGELKDPCLKEVNLLRTDLFEKYKCPLLHDTQKGMDFWLRAGKPASSTAKAVEMLVDLLDVLSAARDVAFLFEHRVKVRKIKFYVSLFRGCERAPELAVAFGGAALSYANSSIIEELEEVYALSEALVDGVAAGRHDALFEQATWPAELSLKGHKALGMYVGCGEAGLRRRLEHLLGDSRADGIVYIDKGVAAKVGEENGVTWSVDACELVWKRGECSRERDVLLELLSQRATANTDAHDAQTELVINIFSPSCTGFFVYAGAFKNQLPSLILNLAKKLAGVGITKFKNDLEDPSVVTKEWLEEMEAAVLQSPVMVELLRFFQACLSLAEDRALCKRLRNAAAPPATVFEVSRNMARVLESHALVPLVGVAAGGWLRKTEVGARVFYQAATMLPLLDLLPACACRKKGAAGRSTTAMVGDSGRAAAIEVAVYDAIILAAVLPLLAAKKLAALVAAAHATGRKRRLERTVGRPPKIDPALEGGV
ncbi:hypothetical protein JL720_16569 [Aureococcus anophagefferens]|nr:hypothetical protein JL720_16569 [Aureococcus anophagefferens]